MIRFREPLNCINYSGNRTKIYGTAKKEYCEHLCFRDFVADATNSFDIQNFYLSQRLRDSLRIFTFETALHKPHI